MTERISNLQDWMRIRTDLRASGKTIGFVPTMGALHRGHASLVERARKENDIVVSSIFVNPLQFNDPKDLERYPCRIEEDLEMLSHLGVDWALMPSIAQMYPEGVLDIQLTESNLSRELCGAHRPGHFNGVLTVVMKLFGLVQPTRAYFGEKDFQQLTLIQEMVKAYFLPLEIVACPTLREDDGLAMSSRNLLLPSEDRARAGLFAKILRESIPRATSSEACRQELLRVGFDVDYVEDRWSRRLAAVKVGAVRLIDNVILEKGNT